MPSQLRSTLLILLLAFCTPLCRAQDQAARMYAGSSVTVNGAKPLAHEALPGDVIEISANDEAILYPSGDEVRVVLRSSAVYTNQKQIDLKNGTTTVNDQDRRGRPRPSVHRDSGCAVFHIPGVLGARQRTRLGS